MRREILIAFALVSLLALFAAEGAIPATDIATTFENGQLIGCVGGTGFEVTDRRTGRTWRPVGGRSPEVEEIARTVDDDGTVRMTYVNSKSRMHWRAAYRVEKEVPEVVVTVEGEGEMAKSLSYPAAFATEKGDRLVVPMNEGISYPVDEPGEIPGRLIAYGGHGICMAFFGVQDDATGAGWMAILETPDDASMIARRDKSTGLWTLGPSWEDQKKRFGYARRVRYIFFDKGGYVAMCKRYRAYAKGIGLFKPFSEKAKERPLVDRLLGAANVWCWEKDKLAVVSNLVEAGIDRFLWSGGGTPEEVSAMAAMPKVLVGRYDCYQDVYYPDQLKKLGRKSGCNTEAWPHDIVWNSVDSNDWRHAWGVKTEGRRMDLLRDDVRQRRARLRAEERRRGAEDEAVQHAVHRHDRRLAVADMLESRPSDDALRQSPLEDGVVAYSRRRVWARRRQRDGARRERAVLRLL